VLSCHIRKRLTAHEGREVSFDEKMQILNKTFPESLITISVQLSNDIVFIIE